MLVATVYPPRRDPSKDAFPFPQVRFSRFNRRFLRAILPPISPERAIRSYDTVAWHHQGERVTRGSFGRGAGGFRSVCIHGDLLYDRVAPRGILRRASRLSIGTRELKATRQSPRLVAATSSRPSGEATTSNSIRTPAFRVTIRRAARREAGQMFEDALKREWMWSFLPSRPTRGRSFASSLVQFRGPRAPAGPNQFRINKK